MIRNNCLIKTIILMNNPGEWREDGVPAYLDRTMKHLSVISWKDNLGSLFHYAKACVLEFEKRSAVTAHGGRMMSMPYSERPKTVHHFYSRYDDYILERNIPQTDPWWLGYAEMHARHQGILLAMDPAYAVKVRKSALPRKNVTSKAGAPGYPWLNPDPRKVGTFYDAAFRNRSVFLHPGDRMQWGVMGLLDRK